MTEIIVEVNSNATLLGIAKNNNAVDAVTEIEKESTEFNAKLLQDTLKTDEYKQALEKEQGQSQAQQNTK